MKPITYFRTDEPLNYTDREADEAIKFLDELDAQNNGQSDTAARMNVDRTRVVVPGKLNPGVMTGQPLGSNPAPAPDSRHMASATPLKTDLSKKKGVVKDENGLWRYDNGKAVFTPAKLGPEAQAVQDRMDMVAAKYTPQQTQIMTEIANSRANRKKWLDRHDEMTSDYALAAIDSLRMGEDAQEKVYNGKRYRRVTLRGGDLNRANEMYVALGKASRLKGVTAMQEVDANGNLVGNPTIYLNLSREGGGEEMKTLPLGRLMEQYERSHRHYFQNVPAGADEAAKKAADDDAAAASRRAAYHAFGRANPLHWNILADEERVLELQRVKNEAAKAEAESRERIAAAGNASAEKIAEGKNALAKEISDADRTEKQRQFDATMKLKAKQLDADTAAQAFEQKAAVVKMAADYARLNNGAAISRDALLNEVMHNDALMTALFMRPVMDEDGNPVVDAMTGKPQMVFDAENAKNNLDTLWQAVGGTPQKPDAGSPYASMVAEGFKALGIDAGLPGATAAQPVQTTQQGGATAQQQSQQPTREEIQAELARRRAAKAQQQQQQPVPLSQPVTSLETPTATAQGQYGLRNDGKTYKGTGWLGELKLPNGGVATEYTMQSDAVRDANGNRIDFPALVPTLTKAEQNLMVNDIIPNRKPVPDEIAQKAVDFARMRLANGQSVFANDGQPPARGQQDSRSDGARSSPSEELRENNTSLGVKAERESATTEDLWGSDVLERFRRNHPEATDEEIRSGKFDNILEKIGTALHGNGYKSKNASFKDKESRIRAQEKQAALQRAAEEARQAHIAAMNEREQSVIRKARDLFGDAWQQADDWAVEHHGEGVFFKDSYKTARAKKFAELVKEKAKKDNIQLYNIYKLGNNVFGTYDVGNVFDTTFGDGAGTYFGRVKSGAENRLSPTLKKKEKED